MRKTRRQRAAELVKMVELGPAFSDIGREEFNPREAARQYKQWVESWVLPEIKRLVPELKPLAEG